MLPSEDILVEQLVQAIHVGIRWRESGPEARSDPLYVECLNTTHLPHTNGDEVAVRALHCVTSNTLDFLEMQPAKKV